MFRQELARFSGVDLGGGLSRSLADLESAGFIRSVRPANKSAGTKLIKYLLTDAYLRFFFSFVRPELAAIRSGHSAIHLNSLVQKPAFHGWRGRAFEMVCMAHAPCIARELFPRKTIQSVLVCHGSVADSVRRSPYIYRVLDSETLLHPN